MAMKRSKKPSRAVLSFDDLDTQKWPSVKLPKGYPSDKKKVFEAKRRAVELYAVHGSSANIKEETGFSRSYASEMFQACLGLDANGNKLGFRALVECDRKSYERTFAETIGAGSFKQFLSNHPSIENGLKSSFYGQKDSRLSNNKISKADYYDLFIILCGEAGIGNDEYPFNTIYCAQRSVYSYIGELRNTKLGMIEHLDRNAKRHLLTTGADKGSILATKPFKVVSLDEHSMDSSFCFYYQDDYGKIAEIELERFIFIPVLDENTGDILGYSYTFKEECDRRDIALAIKDAILPSSRTIEKPSSIKTDLLVGPSHRNIPELQNIPFEAIRVDNAKVHIAADIKHALKGLGVRINYGPVAFPEFRGFIERLFQTLEVLGFRQLPGTLGTGPTDPRRDDAAKEVKRFRLTDEELIYCLEATVQWYNRRDTHRNYYESPLKSILRFVNNPETIVPRLSENKLDLVRDMGITYFPTVRGSQKTGTRPYVQFLSGRYTNEILSDRWDLIGKKISCYLCSDARYAKAYEGSGASVGELVDRSSWGDSPMSFHIRSLLLKKRGLSVHDRVNARDIRPGVLLNMELKGRKVPKRAARTALVIEQDKKVIIREAEERAAPHRPPPKEKETERLPATLEHVGFVRK